MQQSLHYSTCLYGAGYDGWMTSSARHARSAQSYADFLCSKRSRTGTGNSYAAAMLASQRRLRRCARSDANPPEVPSARSPYDDDVISGVYGDGDSVVQSGAAIARRNERERMRVKTINQTFARLRQHLPSSAAVSVVKVHHGGAQASTVTKAKKLSKVQILRAAIQYIGQLQQLLTTSSDDDDDDDGKPDVISDARYSRIEQ